MTGTMMAVRDPLQEPAPALRLIRAEFQEMPGMRLTLRQAARLWCLSEAHCGALLGILVDEHFLVIDRTQRYARKTSR